MTQSEKSQLLSAANRAENAQHRAEKAEDRATMLKILAVLMGIAILILFLIIIWMSWWKEQEGGALRAQIRSQGFQIRSLTNALEYSKVSNNHLLALLKREPLNANPRGMSLNALEAHEQFNRNMQNYMNSDETRLMLVENVEWTDEHRTRWRFMDVENGMVRLTRKYPRHADLRIMLADPLGKGYWFARAEFVETGRNALFIIKKEDREPQDQWPAPVFEFLPTKDVAPVHSVTTVPIDSTSKVSAPAPNRK